MRIAAGLFLVLLISNFLHSDSATYDASGLQSFLRLHNPGQHTNVDVASVRRSLVVFSANNSLVSSSANVNATWPGNDFAAWCMSDPVCSSLPQPTEVAASLNSLPLGNGTWSDNVLALAAANTAVLAGNNTVTNIRAVSELANLTLSYDVKSDTLICNASQPCAATIRFKLLGASLVDPLVCIRLVNNISTGQMQVEGFPVGSDGVTSTGPQVNGYLTCSTTHLGLHAVMQYTTAVLLSPPAPPSPAPPPNPPPVAHTTGMQEVPVGSTSLRVVITYALDFTTLTSNSASVALFTSDTVRYLAQGLAAAFPDLFINVATTLPYYNRVYLNSISPGSVVATYTAQLPQGATQDAVDRVTAFAAAQPAELLAGSSYQTTVTVAQVYSVEETTAKLNFWQIMAIVIGSVAGAAILVAAAFVLVRRHARNSTIVPDNTTGAPSEEKTTQGEEKLATDVMPFNPELPSTPAPTKITILPDGLTIPNSAIGSLTHTAQQDAPPSRFSNLMSRASSKPSDQQLPKQDNQLRKSTTTQNTGQQQQPPQPPSMSGWCVMPMLVPTQDNGKPMPPFEDMQAHKPVQVLPQQVDEPTNAAKVTPAQGLLHSVQTSLPARLSMPAMPPAVGSYASQPTLQPSLPGQLSYQYMPTTLPHVYQGMAQYASPAAVSAYPQAYYTASQGAIGYDSGQYASWQSNAQLPYMYSMYPPAFGFANQGQPGQMFLANQNATIPAQTGVATVGAKTRPQAYDTPR